MLHYILNSIQSAIEIKPREVPKNFYVRDQIDSSKRYNICKNWHTPYISQTIKVVRTKLYIY